MTLNHMTARPIRATRRAFTLLEVLVVVAIIVMLAGLGGYLIIQRYDQARGDAARIKAKDIANKVEAYYIKMGDYPANGLADLIVPFPDGTEPLCTEDAIKDPWNQVYRVEVQQDNNGTRRVIVSTRSPRGQVITNLANN
jgi:general secretion pathway protein G